CSRTRIAFISGLLNGPDCSGTARAGHSAGPGIAYPFRGRMAATAFEKTAVAPASAIAVLAWNAPATHHPPPPPLPLNPPQLNDKELTYFIAQGDPHTGFQGSDRQLAQWAFESWARNAGGSFELRPSSEADSLVRLYWMPLNDDTFGEMRRLSVKGHPGAA